MATTKKIVKKEVTTAKKTAAKAVKKSTPTKAAVEKAASTKAVKEVSPKKTSGKRVNTETPEKFAVIEIVGTQLKVTEGGKYEIAKINLEKGKDLEISEVLMIVDGDKINVGNPYVAGAKVVLEIDAQKKDEKIKVFKYKSKSRYRRTKGHRAEITRVAVKAIKA